ncbi:ABC transporter ATP-binding protein [Bosea sp. RAF48]|uniref:ABC transporter ATP-binding protein n=1 Tax=Bosea sp. RAF48 TaxID=3237480 RepID=UPI003F8E0D6E
MTSTAPIVEAKDLTVDFAAGRGMIRAVCGVDLSLKPGETVALLGESGSGKSVTLRALMRLHPKSAKIGGSVAVDGQDVLALSPSALRAYRGKTVSMIFQDPGLAFDPVYRIGDQIAETVMRHEGVSRAEGRKRGLELFERVRIPSPERRLDNFPHEMSGGMRQRAMIALALACRPKVLLADEPTTALDATVQIQVLLLLRELQREFGLAIVFVTHDIGVAVEVADRIAVMYAGRIVESGSCRGVIRNPAHPYTRGLLASRAHATLGKDERLKAIPGSPPDLAAPPVGCAFGPRCGDFIEECAQGVPDNVRIDPVHTVRCLRAVSESPVPATTTART